MPQVNDLRIGRYDIRVTRDAGASVNFTWPEGYEAVTWTADLGGTALPGVSKNGLDVTVTFTPEDLANVTSATWTLLADAVPVIRGRLVTTTDGSYHGDTSGETTIVVADVQAAVTVIGLALHPDDES